METPSGAEVAFQFYLLVGLVLGVLLAVKCLVQMAFPQRRASLSLETVAGLGALFFAAVLAADAFASRQLAPIPAGLLVLLAIGFAATHAAVSLLQRRGRLLAAQPAAWGAVVLTLAASGWSAHRYHTIRLGVDLESLDSFVAKRTVESVSETVAVTDLGQEVPIYHCLPNDVDGSLPFASPLHPVSARANCHGWVFAEGKYLLLGRDVEKILADNAYEVCASPKKGDLIVYRNAAGEILHTGLVKAIHFGGIPMIESKWGVGGQFVHRPDEQPYGNLITYYRSPRQGHALALRQPKPGPSLPDIGRLASFRVFVKAG